MADSDKLGLGLDDIIRIDGTSNRRGGRGGRRGFRARGGGGGSGRGGGQTNGFRTRGGGGLVNNLFLHIYISDIHSSLEHRMHQQAVGNMIFMKIILIEVEVYNEVLV